MILKRMPQTACFILAGLGVVVAMLRAPASARADVVTSISTLSQVNRLSLFHDYSLNAVGFTTGSPPVASSAGVFDSLVSGSTLPTGQDRSFDFTISPFAGYDSNPEARRAAQDGEFGGLDFDAIYRLNYGPDDPNIGSPTQFRFGFDAVAAAYTGPVFKSDPFQTSIWGSYRRSLFHDTVVVGMLLDNQFTTLHGEAFLNTFDASPSIEWFVLPQISLEANYDYTRMGYFVQTNFKTNPDADRHTVNTKLHFYSLPQVRGDIPESPDQLGDIFRATFSRFTIGYAAVFNRATGLDYVYESNRVDVGLEGIHTGKLPGMTFDLNYAHEWQNFIDPSVEGPIVLAGSPKQRRRKDHVDVFTARGNSHLLDLPENRGTLLGFMQFDLVADQSTIEARHFNEFVVSGGLNYQW